MITRRGFLKAAGLAAVATSVGLSACAPGSGDGGEESGGTNVRFAWWGNEVRQKLTNQAVDAFLAANAGLTVSGEPGDWGGYWDKLATTTAGNNAPDLMQQVDPFIIEYAQRGALADLAEFSNVLDLSPFDEQVMAASTIDGKVYGVPTGLTAPAFWVNPAVLDKVGVAMPDDKTWTWDDFAALTEEVSKKSGGKVTGTAQLSFDEQSFTVFVRQRGENLWDGTKVGFTKDSLVEWWTYALKLQDTGATLNAQKSVEAQQASVEESPMATGKVAFSYGWANQLGQTQEAGDVSLRLLRIPGESTGTAKGLYVKPSQHFSIWSKTGSGESAAKLLNFLVNTVDAGKILGSDRGIPANPTVLEAVQSGFNDGDQKAAAYLKVVSQEATSALPIPPAGASELTAAFPRFSQEVLFKRQAPDQAADALMTELQAAIGG